MSVWSCFGGERFVVMQILLGAQPVKNRSVSCSKGPYEVYAVHGVARCA